jgi:hypothetical protein
MLEAAVCSSIFTFPTNKILIWNLVSFVGLIFFVHAGTPSLVQLREENRDDPQS